MVRRSHGDPQMTTDTQPKKPSKAQHVEKLLTRARGATMAELMAETSWQAHSVRAFLAGLRKKGRTIIKEERKPGLVALRIGTPAKAILTWPPEEGTGPAAEEASA
jgi:hypothetical protein